MQVYYTMSIVAEFAAAISATIFLFKYKNTGLKWILPLLWYILINELLCQYIFPQTQIGYALYNGYSIIVPTTILFLIHSFIKVKKSQLFVRFLIIASLLGFASELTQLNPLNTFLDYSFTLTSIFIIIGLLVYFIQELQDNLVSKVNRNLFLLVCFGFLIFHIPFPIIALVQKNITDSNPELIIALNKVHIILTSVSYFVIAFGFYWGDTVNVTQKKEHHGQ